MKILKPTAIAVLLVGGTTFAVAQTSPQTTPQDPKATPNMAPSLPGQVPAQQAPGTSSGSRPIGPPADATKPDPKKKSDPNDPLAKKN